MANVEVFVCGGTGLVGSALVLQLKRASESTEEGVALRGFCSSKEIVSCAKGDARASIGGDAI